ncbi:putative reverse transcriptase zinc-binding domain-containing protein [Arabidopsis thaliana]
MEVRSGTTTSFWHDHWSPLGRLHQHLGSRGTIDLGIATQATVAEVLDTHRRKRHRADFLNQIENHIELVRQARSQESDRSLWKQKEDSFKGSFSSPKTWQQIRTISNECEWYRGVWFPSSTPKYSFVTWLAFHNRLATGDRLYKWNSEARATCVFCDEELETRDHLFFSCPYSSQIWIALAKGLLNGRNVSSWSLITPHLLDSSQPYLHVFTLRYTFQALIHSLWRERNGRRHGEPAIPASKLTKLIDKNIRNRFSTLQKMGNKRLQGGLQYCSLNGIEKLKLEDVVVWNVVNPYASTAKFHENVASMWKVPIHDRTFRRMHQSVAIRFATHAEQNGSKEVALIEQ